MLSIETAKQIGMKACIDKLGRDFVMQNKDNATSAYGESDKDVFCFVGIDNLHISQNTSDILVLDSYSKFSYRVSCNVSLSDGSAHFLECVTP